MKNIHVLPTDKASRLFVYDGKLGLVKEFQYGSDAIQNQNIYITSDVEIKEGDYFIAYSVTNDKKPFISCASEYKERKEDKGKIILTTDQDLIKDGVQAIDDDFLQWFVENPSCEEVEVKEVYFNGSGYYDENQLSEQEKVLYSSMKEYKIIIPKEEPKQETLEEVAKSHAIYELENNYKPTKESFKLACKRNFIRGAKWQAERMYSEEDMKEAIRFGFDKGFCSNSSNKVKNNLPSEKEWFEQFKKK